MNKWSIVAPATASVRDVAEELLRQRFKQLGRYAALAARNHDEDVEHVHQLRVLVRRTQAALEALEEWLPKKRKRRVAKQLRRLRKVAGPARDLDVMQLRISQASSEHDPSQWPLSRQQEAPLVLRYLHQLRTGKQSSIVEAYKALREHHWVDDWQAVLPRIRWRSAGEAPNYGAWADDQLESLLASFLVAADQDLSELDRLHELRIEAKRLRYGLELVLGHRDVQASRKLVKRLAALQDQLGLVNDHATTAKHFEQWAHDCEQAETADILRNWSCIEQTQAEQLQTRFLQWWTPNRRKKLFAACRLDA